MFFDGKSVGVTIYSILVSRLMDLLGGLGFREDLVRNAGLEVYRLDIRFDLESLELLYPGFNFRVTQSVDRDADMVTVSVFLYSGVIGSFIGQAKYNGVEVEFNKVMLEELYDYCRGKFLDTSIVMGSDLVLQDRFFSFVQSVVNGEMRQRVLTYNGRTFPDHWEPSLCRVLIAIR